MKNNKLKFEYSSPRNDRLKNRGLWIGVYSKDRDVRYSYMYATKRWELDGSPEYKAAMSKDSWCSTSEYCTSFRKFKKRLRKQPELIGIAEFVFRYVPIHGKYEYTIKSVL